MERVSIHDCTARHEQHLRTRGFARHTTALAVRQVQVSSYVVVARARLTAQQETPILPEQDPRVPVHLPSVPRGMLSTPKYPDESLPSTMEIGEGKSSTCVNVGHPVHAWE